MCSKILFVLLVVCFVLNLSNSQRNKKFFRKDYEYLEATQSFYKIHTLRRTWQDAKRMCAQEGAQFFYPEDDDEVQAVLAFWNETQPYTELFVGISALAANGVFETVDGIPILDVYHKWGPGEPNDNSGNENCVIIRKDSRTYNDFPCSTNYPFICKKSLQSLEWNQECNMQNLDYTYNEKMGRCYKFHLKPMNWTDAHAVCSTELSYLAVINSQQEADHLRELTAAAPKEKITGDFLSGAVHLGFHDKNSQGWETIKGTSLEESGYATWSPGQPDCGGGGGANERCGSMFYDGQLNDIGCQQRCFFICEHEIDSLAYSVNIKFGSKKR